MIYQSKSIKDVTEEINVKYFLPHIQRGLVWKPEQISKLFDSLMRGYPISTFLFWKITDKKEDINKLKFIDNYRKGTKNDFHRNTDRDEYWLVLDGQQRLQSFYITLRGTYDDKDFFLNALSNSNKPIDNDVEDDENEIIYETIFSKEKQDYFLKNDLNKKNNNSNKKVFVKVKSFAILDDDKILDFIDKVKNSLGKDLSYDDTKLLERNIKKLQMLVHSDIISYYLEQEQNYNKVLDIFIRTNSGGTKLSKSDLLFSMIKLHWKNQDAYKEFNQLEKDLNNAGDFEFDKDFILKTSLVLINADPRYRVENFKQKNIFAIEERWNEIKSSIVITIDLLKNLGIVSKKILTSKNSIIPIVYYTYLNKIRTYESEETFIANSKQIIKNWLINILLVKLYSSQTDEMLKRAKAVIDDHKKEVFPGKEIINKLPPGKSIELKQETFNEISFNDDRVPLVLSLLYHNFNLNALSSTNKLNIDHIFPRSLANKKNFDNETLNNIGNLEPLTDTENKSKNDKLSEEWLKSRDISFLQKNYIPTDKNLYSTKNYKEFINQRREIMFQQILKEISS